MFVIFLGMLALVALAINCLALKRYSSHTKCAVKDVQRWAKQYRRGRHYD